MWDEHIHIALVIIGPLILYSVCSAPLKKCQDLFVYGMVCAFVFLEYECTNCRKFSQTNTRLCFMCKWFPGHPLKHWLLVVHCLFMIAGYLQEALAPSLLPPSLARSRLWVSASLAWSHLWVCGDGALFKEGKRSSSERWE